MAQHSHGGNGEPRLKKEKVVKIKTKEKHTEPDPAEISFQYQESLTWVSDPDAEFTVEVAALASCGPRYPFGPTNPGPIRSQRDDVEVDGQSKYRQCVKLGPAIKESIGHVYKATFVIGSQVIDPHIIVDP
jgi:hypothetical protein